MSSKKDSIDSFEGTLHCQMSILASHFIQTRHTASEAMAMTELWVSAGVFDALEVSIGEVLRYGTDEDQMAFCRASSHIWVFSGT